MANRLREFRQMLKSQGMARSLANVVSSLRWRCHHYVERSFDRKYGVDTCQVIAPGGAAIDPQSLHDAGRHEPVTVAYFERMLGSVNLPYHEFTFIDVGCGLGRALLLANKYQFKRIIGVEFDHAIHRHCVANVVKFQRKVHQHVETEVICSDATAFRWPEEDSFVFLYNPFRGETFRKVIDNLAMSLSKTPRRIVILYRNPVCANILSEYSQLELVGSGPGFKIYTTATRL